MKKISPIPFEEEYVAINENNPINQYMLHFKVESAKVLPASNNTAKLFKRLMGTNTKICFECNDSKMTPEECSSEILKTLYYYMLCTEVTR